ncbi:hypothetical protein [Novosphingobium soli]
MQMEPRFDLEYGRAMNTPPGAAADVASLQLTHRNIIRFAKR